MLLLASAREIYVTSLLFYYPVCVQSILFFRGFFIRGFAYSRFFLQIPFFADFQKTANKYLSTDFRKKPRISVEKSPNLSPFSILIHGFLKNRE